MPLIKLKNFFSDLTNFIKNVANDSRIPDRDKKIILGLLVLIVSPVDLIPDWIPVIGLLDDAVLLAIILDYFFDVLDQDILLSHYPWGMKSFARLRRASRLISFLTPEAVKSRLWKYQGDPYKSRLK